MFNESLNITDTDKILYNYLKATSNSFNKILSFIEQAETDEEKVPFRKALNQMTQKEKKEILAHYNIWQGKGKDTRWKARLKDSRKILTAQTESDLQLKIIQEYVQLGANETLQDVIASYIAYREFNGSETRKNPIVSNSTRKREEQSLKRFLHDYLDYPFNKISIEMIVDSYNAVDCNQKAANAFKNSFIKMLEYCQSLGKVTMDTSVLLKELNRFPKDIQPIYLYEKTDEIFTSEERTLFLRYAIEEDTLLSLGLALLFYTGLRIGELCALKEEYIDFESNTIMINTSIHHDKMYNTYFDAMPKKYINRKVVFPNVAVPILKRIIELSDRDNPYLFSDTSSSKISDFISRNKFDKEIARICKAIGMKDVKRCHKIRKTYDTMLVSQMPSAYRHLLMGHVQKGIDKHYVFLSSNDIPNVLSMLNQIFESDTNNIWLQLGYNLVI